MLTQLPLCLSSEWRNKVVTTRPPEYVEHLEWALVVTLSCVSQLRVVTLLRSGNELRWRAVADPASTAVELRLSFFPSDWQRSDEVEVNFGYERISLSDEALKRDPRRVLLLTAPASARTGAVLALAELASHDLSLSALALAEADTQRRRMQRWRVRPRLAEALPEQLLPLASGAQGGVIRPHTLTSKGVFPLR